MEWPVLAIISSPNDSVSFMQVADDMPFNELRIQGNFSMSEMHGWLMHCLPEVPPRSPTSETEELNFRNVLFDTHLMCKYKV